MVEKTKSWDRRKICDQAEGAEGAGAAGVDKLKYWLRYMITWEGRLVDNSNKKYIFPLHVTHFSCCLGTVAFNQIKGPKIGTLGLEYHLNNIC